MNDHDKTREGLIEELAQLRRRITAETALPPARTAAALLQVAPLGIHECDTEGRITFVNPLQETITGFSAEELVGTYVWDRLVPGPEKDSLPAYFHRLVAERPAPSPFFAKNIKKGGEVFDVRVDWNYLRNPQGDITGFVCIVSDITERNQAELALQQAHDELERRVRERTAELTRANELLQAEVEQRRQAEQALRDSESRLSFALEVSGAGAWDLDLVNHTAHRSLQHDRIFGYQSLLPGWTYEGFLEHVLPEDREMVDHQFQHAIDSQGDWRFECRIRRSDGQIRWIWAAGRHRPDQGDAARRMTGIVQDITDRKRSEDALRESFEELWTIYHGMVDGILMAEIQTKNFVKANRAIGQMLGYSPEQLLSMSVRDIHPQTAAPAVGEAFQLLAEGRILQVDSLPMLRRDGSVFFADITGSRIVYHGRPCLMGFFRDVTERQQAEMAMRQTLAQLETICGGIIEGLLITDIETKRFLRVNASLCQMLGYSEEELLAASIKDIHPAEEVPNDLQRFQAAAEGRVAINVDRPVLKKDGSVFFADITGHRVIYDERPCLLALFRDVTERKQAEAKLERERQALRRMVMANDHERHLITDELHDGVAQQLLGAKLLFESQQPPKGRKSKAAEAYRDGMEALTQASSGVRRVMNWLRTPVLDRFGLVDAIADLAAQLKSAPGAPDIEYQHDVTFHRLEPTLENALFRIAQEALTNACRFSQSEKVRVELTQRDHDVTLEVRDWGIGFDLDTVEEDHFGLEGIRERAKILGGELNVRSQPGEGTVIRVQAPVLEATDEA